MISRNLRETKKIAEKLVRKLLKESKKNKGALIVGLSGDLGSGKTTFTKSVAKNLGIKDRVFSPTFVIFKKYPIKLDKYKFFFHMDAYRLKNENELKNLGWDEIIKNDEHLIFIEWPENIAKAIPSNARFIYISSDEDNFRNFILK